MKQTESLEILKTGANVFLTGEPGAGKTYTINAYVKYLREKKIEPAITASTGIAATHIGGMTVHSWSGIGIKTGLTKSDLNKIISNSRRVKRIRRAKALIIEEVSMLAPNTLSMVDAVCRAVKQDPRPFGGIQTVLVGDFFQLPPVVREAEQSKQGQLLQSPLPRFAYDSPAWSEAAPVTCYLTEQYRQDDADYLRLLTAVRGNTFGEDEAELIHARHIQPTQLPPGIPKLYSHNADVDRINLAVLSKLSGEVRTFTMNAHGSRPLVESLKRGCLSPEELLLKEGAAVMFTKNDREGRYVNGTLGTVIGFGKESGLPIVKTRDGRVIEAEPTGWTVEEGEKILAEIAQVPLRLAWAITIHKSQGMTLEAAVVDLSRVFEYGQGYVALSRIRRLSGLHILGWNKRAFEVHPAILAKDGEFRRESERVTDRFNQLGREMLKAKQVEFVGEEGRRTDQKADRFSKIRETYPNAYRPWSKEQDSRLEELYSGGVPIKKMAEVFGRKRGAIRSRLVKLGLIE